MKGAAGVIGAGALAGMPLVRHPAGPRRQHL
ncbi:hypothetical protein [Halococcus sediminicola]|nr:hypothetical protein [Halococcus sediminicola]